MMDNPNRQTILDAIKASDLPKEAKTVAFALTYVFTGIRDDLKRIADALEKSGHISPKKWR